MNVYDNLIYGALNGSGGGGGDSEVFVVHVTGDMQQVADKTIAEIYQASIGGMAVIAEYNGVPYMLGGSVFDDDEEVYFYKISWFVSGTTVQVSFSTMTVTDSGVTIEGINKTLS